MLIITVYCLLRRRIKGAARAFYSHNVRLDVQRLWNIRCFMIFHIVQEVTPETVLGRTQQDWAGDIEGVEGRPHQAVSLRIHSSIAS